MLAGPDDDRCAVRMRRTRSLAAQTSRLARRAVRSSRDRKFRTAASFLRVTNRIFYSGFKKTFEPQETGIALAAGETFRCWIVTAVGKRKIDTDLDCFAHDFGFRKFDQRPVNLKASALDTGFCSKIGQVLERFDKFRSAIW